MKLHDKHIFHSMELNDSVNSGALDQNLELKFCYGCSDMINFLVSFFYGFDSKSFYMLATFVSQFFFSVFQLSTLFFELIPLFHQNIITRPNCALDRSTSLSLYVPGFPRKFLKYVPKCEWIPQTKFQWIPHTYTCNVNFVGTFVLLRFPQQTIIAFCSGFRNCKWKWQNLSGIRKCKRIPQTVSGFRILFNTELAYELKAELEFLSLAMRNLKAKN